MAVYCRRQELKLPESADLWTKRTALSFREDSGRDPDFFIRNPPDPAALGSGNKKASFPRGKRGWEGLVGLGLGGLS